MQTLSATSLALPAALGTALAEYRHKVFIERLGWRLPTEHGLERDQFDLPGTLYVVAREDNGSICGCARLLPTTRPYLLSEVFPQLMADQPLPRTRTVWELSRFAAVSTNPATTRDGGNPTQALLAAAVQAAAQRGARRLITVSPLGVERLLHRMGVHAHRAGPPALLDGKPAFACWIEIDQQTNKALGLAIPTAAVGPAAAAPQLRRCGVRSKRI